MKLIITVLLTFCYLFSTGQDGAPGTISIQKKDMEKVDTLSFRGRAFINSPRLSFSVSTAPKFESLGSFSLRYGNLQWYGISLDYQHYGLEGRYFLAGIYLRFIGEVTAIGAGAVSLIFEVNDAFGVYNIQKGSVNQEGYNKLGFAFGLLSTEYARMTIETMLEYRIHTSKGNRSNGLALTLRIYF